VLSGWSKKIGDYDKGNVIVSIREDYYGLPGDLISDLAYWNHTIEGSTLTGYNLIVTTDQCIYLDAGNSYWWTIEAADNISEELNDLGVETSPYHTKVNAKVRREILEELAGDLECVVAVRTLDEGVDLPDVDCGVIISGTSQKRQMIQRMGRVLRRKPDNRGVTFIVVYAKDTTEDPAMHHDDDGNISMIIEHAEIVSQFEGDEIEDDDLREFAIKCRDLYL